MMRRPIGTAIVLGLLLSSQAARGADDPLDAIPQEAGVLIRMAQPQATAQKAINFANRVNPQFGPAVQSVSTQMGQLISNPQMAGVDQKQDWWVAVFPRAEQEPGIVFAVAADDAEAMRKAVPEPYEFVEHENWLLYTRDADAKQSVADCAADKGESARSVINENSRDLFDGGDMAVFVNVDRLKKVYKTQIEEFRQQAKTQLEQQSQTTPQTPGLDPTAALQVAEQFLQTLLQMIDDTETFTGTVTIREDSLRIDELVTVTADSPTDRFLQKQEPSRLTALEKLPPDQLAYFGFHGDMAGLMKAGMQMSLQMFEANNGQDGEDSEKQDVRKELEQVLDEYSKLQFGDSVGSFHLGNMTEGVIRTIVLLEAEPIDKLRETMRKTMRAMAKQMAAMSFNGFSQKMELEEDAEKFGEHSADVVTTTMEFGQQPGNPFGMQMQRMMEIMYGPGGMKQRTVYLDGLMVQTSGPRSTMEEALKRLEGDGSSEDDEKTAESEATENGAEGQALSTARKRFAEKVNLLFVIDLPGLAADALRLALQSGQLPLPIDPNALPSEKDRSYLGFSATTEPGGVRMRTDIGIGQFKGIAKLVSVFQGMQQQQPQF